MNVPPVAATQTEWRRCGPPGGFSLPVCFNDSDTELATRDTPISDKVQMIIESLRSTQSSLEMGDEIEGNVLSGQEGHTQVCKVAVGSYVGAKCKTKSATGNPKARVSSTNNHDSSDSDSDDSVDRGIEEAILEYLKEKDDHKRKAEPCSAFVHSSKIPRKNPSTIEVSKQNAESQTFISNSQLPRNVKVETPVVTATIPLKKYIKNKASLDENFDLNKSLMKTLVSSNQQNKSISTTVSLFNKFPVTVKVEKDSNDSSSDDGIEEAIQRYQLEKEQQSKKETFNSHAFQEESDSTSDDGIEEAIRSYQLEQLKEKSVLKPLLQKQKPVSKPSMHAEGSTSTEKTKKHKLKSKKGRTEKQMTSFRPHPSSVLIPKTAFSDDPKGKGNRLLSPKEESLNQQAPPTPSKVNTTAELMCAEAILDISKTVMPGAFHHNIGLNSCAPTDSSLHLSVPNICPYEESNDSSIDSEDGIEQEIRKFLEQKAQMHKQPPSSKEACDIHESEKVKVNEVAIQKKQHRLSLTQRRKNREKSFTVSNVSGSDDKSRETSLMPLPEPTKESNPSTFTQRNQTYPITALHKANQSGDKSSSLDSDEDLDTAIKDLLKTKKKSKKKIRDLKRKSRKCIKDEEQLLGGTSLTKKLRPEPTSKCSALKKAHKNKDEGKDKAGLSQKIDKNAEDHMHKGKIDTLKGAEGGGEALPPMRDDSSSVDSDDSIEQEIRKFLAEKAKVSTAEKTKDGDVSRNGTVSLQDADIKQETQLAEIPRKSTSPLSGSPGCPVQDKAPQRPPDICPTSAQSCLLSVQSCSPGLLEPADGAGAAGKEQRRLNVGRDDVRDAIHQTEKGRPVLSPNIAHSRAESIKWRQSLGLPISDKRTPSRTPFQITSSEIGENPSASLPHPNKAVKLQTPATAWFSSRTTTSPFSCSPDTAVKTAVRPPVLKFFSAARQHSRMSFTQSLTPAHRSQFPLEEERASMVHVPKDKSVFVELESNMTNHVQVQSRERSEGKDRVECLNERNQGERMKIDKKEEHQDRQEEEFIDESDCESGSKKDPDNKQGFSTL